MAATRCLRTPAEAGSVSVGLDWERAPGWLVSGRWHPRLAHSVTVMSLRRKGSRGCSAAPVSTGGHHAPDLPHELAKVLRDSYRPQRLEALVPTNASDMIPLLRGRPPPSPGNFPGTCPRKVCFLSMHRFRQPPWQM